MHESISIGSKQVSFIERCPLFRVSFTRGSTYTQCTCTLSCFHTQSSLERAETHCRQVVDVRGAHDCCSHCGRLLWQNCVQSWCVTPGNRGRRHEYTYFDPNTMSISPLFHCFFNLLFPVTKYTWTCNIVCAFWHISGYDYSHVIVTWYHLSWIISGVSSPAGMEVRPLGVTRLEECRQRDKSC